MVDLSNPSRTVSPIKGENSVSKIRSRSNTDSLLDKTQHDAGNGNPFNNTNTNTNTNTGSNSREPSTPSHSKKTSISLQPPYSNNHRRSQSILSQLSSHVRNLSIDSSNPSTNLSNPLNKMNSTCPGSPTLPQKGKISPENSPKSSKYITSPVKVSGVAAGPDATNLILEIETDMERYNHAVSIPNLSPIKYSNSVKIGFQDENGNEINDDPLSPIGHADFKAKLQDAYENSNGNTAARDGYDNDNENENSNNKKGILEKLVQHYPHLNIIVSSILLWYAFSMSISVYNRWMFSSDNLYFRYPIIITSFHQFILTLLAILTLILFPQFRLSQNLYKTLSNKEVADEDLYDDEYANDTATTYTMPVKEYLTNILPCSVASAGDIGLGNTAFRFITLSLYTMVKTSSLVFVLLWGVFFKLEKFTLRILSIVCIMTFGVSMMIWGQHDSNNTPSTAKLNDDKEELLSLIKRTLHSIRTNSTLSTNMIFLGVSLVLLSACMSGLRWALTQIMLKKNRRTKNPILTMMYISPGMCVVLLVVGSIVEGFGNFLDSEIWEAKGVVTTMVLILIPGFLAFFMTISEYVLLQYASLLTLSIAGIFKELLTIFVSWVVFGDRLSFINIIGLCVTFADIIWYNIYRFEQNTEAAKKNEPEENEFVDIEMDNINI